MSAQPEVLQPPQRVARSTSEYRAIDSNKLGLQTVVDGEVVDVKVTAKRWKSIKNAAANSGVEPTEENLRTFSQLVSQADKNESGNFYASVDAGDKNNPKAYSVEAAIAESMNKDGYADLLNDPNALVLVKTAIENGALTAENVSRETVEKIIAGEAPAAGEPSAPAPDPQPDIPALAAKTDADTEAALAATRAQLEQATGVADPVVEADPAPDPASSVDTAVDLPDVGLREGDEPSELQKGLQSIYDALEAEVQIASPADRDAGLGQEEIGQLQTLLIKVEGGDLSLTENESNLLVAGVDNSSFSKLDLNQKALIEQAFAEIKSKLPAADPATETPTPVPDGTELTDLRQNIVGLIAQRPDGDQPDSTAPTPDPAQEAPAPTEVPQTVTDAVPTTIEASLPKSRADLETQAKVDAGARMEVLVNEYPQIESRFDKILEEMKLTATSLLDMTARELIEKTRSHYSVEDYSDADIAKFAPAMLEYADLQLETWRNEFVPDYFLKLGQELGLRNARIRLVEVPGIQDRVPQIESLGASDARDTLNMVLQEITLSGAYYGFTTDQNGVMTMVSESARYYDIALDGSKGITPRETFEADAVTLKHPDYLNRMIAGDLKTLNLTILKAAPKESKIYLDAKQQVANQMLTPDSKFGHSFVTALRVMAKNIDAGNDAEFENFGSKDIVKSRELMLKLSSAMATEGKFDFVGATPKQQAEFLAAFAGYLDAAMKDPKSQETTVDPASLLPGQEAKPYRDDFLESLNHDLDYLFVGWPDGSANGGFVDQMLRAGDEYGGDFDEAKELNPQKSKDFYDRALKPYAKDGSLADYLGKRYEDAFEKVIAPIGGRNERKVVNTENAGRLLRATLMADDLSKTVDLLADSDFTPLAKYLVDGAGKLSGDLANHPSKLKAELTVLQNRINNATDDETRTRSADELKRLFAQTINSLKRMKKEDAAKVLSAYSSQNIRDGIASFMPEIPMSISERAFQKLVVPVLNSPQT